MKQLYRLLFVFCLMLPVSASAQGLSIIRDTETENALREWGRPIFEAAGLNPRSINMVLVDNSSVNAFVAGGANIFMFAGLIEKADFVDEVIGVIAHETGHITGGHLIASRRAMEKASYQSILGTILGVGAAIATGDGRAAGAIAGGGSALAAQGYFSHSRAQESAADQAALSYFDRAEKSPEGLVTFMQKLEGEELLPVSQQSEYMRTHPLTRDRVDALRAGLDRSRYADRHAGAQSEAAFKRIKAKLIAFRSPQNVPRFYTVNGDDPDARYAYAIMHYRQKHFDKALEGFDALIADFPKNPYYHEMKAQTLRDAGRLSDAEWSYRKALDLLNGDAPLIQIALAHILIELDKNANEAETLLLTALKTEKRDTRPYRLLATIEGRRNNESAARYYLAEEATAQGRMDEARRLLVLAMDGSGLRGATAVKARDLKSYLDGLPDRDD